MNKNGIAIRACYLCKAFTWLFLSYWINVSAVAQGPVAYYSFDNSPQDGSGNKNHGTIYGNVTLAMDRFGNPCGAYHFDGTSAYIQVPTSTSLESLENAFTITCWYRFDRRNDNNWLTVLCKGAFSQEATNNPQYRLQVQQNTAQILNTCSPYTPSGSSTISVNTEFTKCDPSFDSHLLETGGWSFYAIVFDGKAVMCYMNGNKVFDYPYLSTLQRNNSDLYIGKDEPGVTEYFEGALDDIYIFNRALTDQEIISQFKKAGTTVKEEFELSSPVGQHVRLQAGQCEAKVNFAEPTVLVSHCAKVDIHQVRGQPSGSKFKTGRHLISYEAVSETGYVQSYSFYIQVLDAIPPVFDKINDTVIIVNAGESGIRYSFAPPGASDNCGIREIRQVEGLRSGEVFTVGKHDLTFLAIDVNGNTTRKTLSVEVKNKIFVNPPAVKTPEGSTKPVVRVFKPDTVAKVVPIQTPVVKRDSIINPAPAVKKDSTITYKPPELFSRENQTMRTIEVDNNVLQASLYDNGTYDGDTVSILLNSEVLLAKTEITVKGQSFEIVLDSSRESELIMYAENLGSIPPNTALLILMDGETRYEINLLSTLKTNGMIRIRKRK